MKISRTPTKTTDTSSFSFAAFFALLGMLGFATTLSILIFSKTSLRLDEAQSLFQVSRDLSGTLYQVAQDVHVPGYHILLQAWTFIFDTNDITAARYLSLLFFLLTIPAVYFLAKSVFNRRVGLFSALLVTISPFMQWYGSEARMYSMLAFFAVVHHFVFLKLFREGRPVHWVLYTALTIAGLYTHYFFAFVVLTELIFFLIYKRQFPAKSFRRFVIAGFVSLAALLPWLIYVFQLGTASNTQPSLTSPSSGDLFNTYAQFIFGFQVDALNTIIVSLWPIVVLLAFAALRKNRHVPPQALFFVLAAVIPVIGAFIISITIRPFYLSRYLIVALPALLIAIAWVLSNYPKKVRRILQTVLCFLILGLLAVQVINPNTPVKEDYEAATSYLEQNATSRDVIVVTAPFTIYPVEYYYQGQAKLTTQPIWDRFNKGAVPPYRDETVKRDTEKNVSSYQYAWLLLSYDQGYNKKMKTYYDSRFERVLDKEFSPNLTVYKYKIRYDPPVKIEGEVTK